MQQYSTRLVMPSLVGTTDLGPDIIRGQIEGYRSPTFFPGEVEFRVSDWRTASGGNPRPHLRIVRYEANETGLRGAAELDLPLNGRWSSLEADFVWCDNENPEQGFYLRMEEISSREGCRDDLPA
jgi:hypothetical protein